MKKSFRTLSFKSRILFFNNSNFLTAVIFMDIEDNHRIPLHKRIEAGSIMASRHRTLETVTLIAQDFGISRNRLYLLEAKNNEDPTMADLPRSGRPKKFDRHVERRIMRES